jgi:curved DNA-binding protein CbpA
VSIRSPYQVLGVPPNATDGELRSAYRRLVQLHHPDHNAGSAESARRFEEVQDAYAQVLRERKAGPPPPPPRADAPAGPELDKRLQDLERQVKAARERAQRTARKAAQQAARARGNDRKRPSDEELGYYSTEDNFTSIINDAREQLSGHLKHAGEHPVARRVTDLIEGLEELASKLDRPTKK